MLMGAQQLDVSRLGELRLFADVDNATLYDIADGGRAINATRGQRIVSSDDRLEGFYVVCDGKLKVYILSCDGAERTLRILQAGDDFGIALMSTGLPSPVFAEALTTSQIAFIPSELAQALLARDKAFSDALFTSMSRLTLDLVYDIESCCTMNALQRTVVYLLRLADAEKPNLEIVDLPASKWVVAGLLSLTPETFSRELHRLQSAGLIEIVRRTIHIKDLAGLRAIVKERTRDKPLD